MRFRRRSHALLAAILVGQVAVSTPAAQAGGTSSSSPPPGRTTSVPQASRPSPTGTDAATTFGLRWIRPAGHPVLVLRVVDHTGRAWPVHAAARLWATPHVRLVIADSCVGPGPCVVVREGRFGRTGWTGRTRAEAGLMESFVSPVAIDLNDSYDSSAQARRATACHELGHALGLGHDNRPTSCLQPSAVFPRPAAFDLDALERLYAVPD